ncbi:MAG: hypothetical protein ACRENH_18270 [Gemmatimonadaceae bacterium]
MPGRKFARFAARVLMTAGLGAGILGVLMWSFGIRFHVPDWMWRVAAVKLTFAAAVGLVAAGALLLRHLKKSERMDASLGSALPDESARALGAASWTPEWRPREQEPQRITTPPEQHGP